MPRNLVPVGLPQQPSHSVRLLTERQAADVAGVHRKTIRRLIEQGRLRAADYGTAGQHNYRIDPAELAKVTPLPGLPPTVPHELLMPPARVVRAGRPSGRTGQASAYLPRVSPKATGSGTRR